jgi:hypothetical protein
VRRLTGVLRDNGLSLAFAAAFLLVLAAQALAGHAEYNHTRAAGGLDQVTLGAYLTSSDFAVDVTENWQSEYLQFFLYVYATVWLVQRGSPESKALDRAGRETGREQLLGPHARPDSPRWARAGRWRQVLYANSLGLVMGALFVLSWLAQSVSGLAASNEERLRRFQAPQSWGDYVLSAEFWGRTLQNWQSEMLAMVSMVVFSVYLRQRGSPESKPVGAPHDTTGMGG